MGETDCVHCNNAHVKSSGGSGVRVYMASDNNYVKPCVSRVWLCISRAPTTCVQKAQCVWCLVTISHYIAPALTHMYNGPHSPI